MRISDWSSDVCSSDLVAIRIGEVRDPNYVAVRLFPNRRVVCGTPEYFNRYGVPRVPEDLSHHNCLAFNLQGGQQRGWIFVRDDKPFAVRVDGDLACNDGELLYGWVRQSLGVGWRRSDESSVGTEGVSTCGYGWSRYHEKKKK